MSAKHTPGPWFAAAKAFHPEYPELNDNVHYIMLETKPGRCMSVVIAHANTAEDSRLIAAAPELLKALIECLECEFAVTDKAAIEKARAAIAKATGSAA